MSIALCARTVAKVTLAAVLCLCSAFAAAQQQIEVMWLGHATFRFTSTTGKVIVIDPFLTKNPRTPLKYKDPAAFGKVDLILVTHGHPDHIGDLPALAKATGATVVANYELANNLVSMGLLDGSKTIALNKGGTVSPLGPGIKVHMVPAEHSSSIDMLDAKPDPAGSRYIPGGVALYDTGDTDVFTDMALIGRFYKPDLALVCIGGHFTMDPEHAAYALREFIRPKQVIPMHYGTFPVMNRTPAELRTALGNAPIKVLELKPGESLKF